MRTQKCKTLASVISCWIDFTCRFVASNGIASLVYVSAFKPAARGHPRVDCLWPANAKWNLSVLLAQFIIKVPNIILSIYIAQNSKSYVTCTGHLFYRQETGICSLLLRKVNAQSVYDIYSRNSHLSTTLSSAKSWIMIMRWLLNMLAIVMTVKLMTVKLCR